MVLFYDATHRNWPLLNRDMSGESNTNLYNKIDLFTHYLQKEATIISSLSDLSYCNVHGCPLCHAPRGGDRGWV